MYQAIDLCHEVGINNVSLDLIYALPGETLADLKADLDAFLNCKVDHISIYSLQIEANSVFGKQHLQPCDSDLEADMYECIEKTLTAAGYTHYEISSYAKIIASVNIIVPIGMIQILWGLVVVPVVARREYVMISMPIYKRIVKMDQSFIGFQPMQESKLLKLL